MEKKKKKELRTYHGSCHCKKVRIKVELDLSHGIGKCNCTFCFKTGIRLIFTSAKNFKLLAGKEFLRNYPPRGQKKDKDMYFCKVCGVRCFTRCKFEMPPYGKGFYAININALDDLSPDKIISAPKHYGDGLHDNWGQQPKEIRHL